MTFFKRKNQLNLLFENWKVLICKTFSPLHPRMLCAKILKLCKCIFFIMSPWKRALPFIWENLKFLQPKLLCAKFGWNQFSSRWNFVNVFRYFVIYRQTVRQTEGRTMDNRRSVKLNWAFSSGELKTQQTTPPPLKCSRDQ